MSHGIGSEIVKKIVVIFTVIILMITGCKNQENKKNDAILFKEEYEKLNGEKKSDGQIYRSINIPNDNAIVYSNVEEILSLLENKTGIIYFGSSDCLWCRNAIPILLNTANMVGIEKIYYFNASQIRDQKHLDQNGNIKIDKEGSEDYDKLLTAFHSVLPSYKELNDESIKRLYFPTVIFIKDGNIIGIHVGTVPSQQDPNIPLTSQEEKELSEIYSNYMHEILGDICDESC